MTVPTGSRDDVRSQLFNAIIDETADGIFLATMQLDIAPQRSPITPANFAHAIGELEHTRTITGQLVFEQGDHKTTRFATELADSGPSAYSPNGATLAPEHSLRLNDPLDTSNTNDLFLPKVVFSNYRLTYGGQDARGKLRPTVDFTALLPTSGAFNGKLLEIGTAFTPPV